MLRSALGDNRTMVPGMLRSAGMMMALIWCTQTAMSASTELIVEVAAGDVDRQNTPVFFELPASLRNEESFRLVRADDGATIDVQPEPESERLIWLIRDRLAAGKTRRYRLTLLRTGRNPVTRVTCRDDGRRLIMEVGERKVLCYNHAIIPSPDPSESYYARSGHIHPVYSPRGVEVTDDFPPDHPHQHGIMFAWTSASFEGHPVNFWDQKGQTGMVEHAAVKSIVEGPVFAEFTASIQHAALISTGERKPVLTESWTIRVYDVSERFLFDFVSEQKTAGVSPFHIDEYQYGAMAFRGRRNWLEPGQGDFLTSERKTRADGNHSQPKWVDMYGQAEGDVSGLGVLAHTDNFRFPQFVRLHPRKPYFCFAPMVTGEFEITPGSPYRSAFRFCVHDGAAADILDRLWQDYADPPRVRIVE